MSELANHAEHLGALSAELGNLGIAGALFVAGLLGGITHCAAMCGPFVLAQVSARRSSGVAYPELHRLSGTGCVPYHLGRLSTYALLGALAGGLSSVVMGWPGMRGLALALLLLAALAFLAQALKALGVRLLSPVPSGGPPGLAQLVGRLARPLFVQPYGVRGYGLGLALGFIPCGLLYGALAAAAATGSAATAALAMVAFGLGTAPGLVALGLTGRWVARRWPAARPRLSAAFMTASAAILLAFAWQLHG